MKKIVIIGSGNVAEAFAGALPAASYKLVQIVARNAKRGAYLAQKAGCEFTDDFKAAAKADIYLIAVTDSAIGEVSSAIDFGSGVVAHTAGGVSIDDLSPKITDKAVLYPLQTFTAGREINFQELPLFIEASTPRAFNAIETLAQKLSGSVRFVSSVQRAQVHLAAVFASNFSNYMYVVAESLLGEEGMEFDLLKPLIRETADKAVAASSPSLTQTGPAVRGDAGTQKTHMKLLHDKSLRKIYKSLSNNIWQTLRKK